MWNDRQRHDGTMVDRFDGGWLILTTDERPVVDICPCCRVPLASQEAAQRVADQVFPTIQLNGG